MISDTEILDFIIRRVVTIVSPEANSRNVWSIQIPSMFEVSHYDGKTLREAVITAINESKTL